MPDAAFEKALAAVQTKAAAHFLLRRGGSGMAFVAVLDQNGTDLLLEEIDACGVGRAFGSGAETAPTPETAERSLR